MENSKSTSRCNSQKILERGLYHKTNSMRKTDIDIKDNEEKVRSGDLPTMNEKVNMGTTLLNSKIQSWVWVYKNLYPFNVATMIKMLKHCFENIENISSQNKDSVRILYVTHLLGFKIYAFEFNFPSSFIIRIKSTKMRIFLI